MIQDRSDLVDHLAELVTTVKARAWAEGYRCNRGRVDPSQVDLLNPYVQEVGHTDG